MIAIEAGHVYELRWLDGDPWDNAVDLKANSPDGRVSESRLIFVNREEDSEHGGTQTQEVLRALIDRTMHCDNCLRWPGNDLIIHHLRMALVLHEARALERKTEKGVILPEEVRTDTDGHFMLDQSLDKSEDAVTHALKERT